MYPFGGILVASLVAGYLVSVICRLALHRGRKPQWFAAVIGAFVGGFCALVFTFQADLFDPSQWDKGKTHLPTLMTFVGSVGAVVSLAVGFSIVSVYRDRMKKS